MLTNVLMSVVTAIITNIGGIERDGTVPCYAGTFTYTDMSVFSGEPYQTITVIERTEFKFNYNGKEYVYNDDKIKSSGTIKLREEKKYVPIATNLIDHVESSDYIWSLTNILNNTNFIISSTNIIFTCTTNSIAPFWQSVTNR